LHELDETPSSAGGERKALAMNKLLIRGGRVLQRHGWSPATDVRIEEGLIDRIDKDLAAPGGRVIDARDCIVVPGFVDLHLHGAFGFLCESGQPEALVEISRRLPEVGVTSFLPTIAALPRQRLQRVVEAIAMTAGAEPGARILGIHLEGPFLNRHCAGAQNRRWMRPPDLTELDELLARGNGLVRMVTLAPELPGALPLIAALSERGVTVALGHSEATEEETLLAVDAGATHVTHLFNAMRPFHHREPGLVGVALSESSLTVELIADGHHVHPRAIDLAWRSRNGNGIVLVSDAVALGAPEGEYEFLGKRYRIQAGAVRLAGNGRLAGSCLALDAAIRNLVRWLPRVAHERIFWAASTEPCKAIGADELGTIEPGKIADLVVLDEAYTVQYTIVGGKVVYERAGHAPL